jgi:uncharacterized protein YjiS (DUF1127 family)|tara:strand:- start:1324 stop:1542 length:219 start_codon:yes stop_codon:yes gene_type:complete
MELVNTAPSRVFVIVKAILKSISKFFSKLGASIARSQQLRADYWILKNMSDNDLRDIGITRGEIRDRCYDTK